MTMPSFNLEKTFTVHMDTQSGAPLNQYLSREYIIVTYFFREMFWSYHTFLVMTLYSLIVFLLITFQMGVPGNSRLLFIFWDSFGPCRFLPSGVDHVCCDSFDDQHVFVHPL